MSSELDILYIDSLIKKKLLEKINPSQTDLNKKELLEWIIENSGNETERIKAKKDLTDLMKQLDYNKFGLEYIFYTLRTEELIAKYKLLTRNLKQSSFVKKVEVTSDTLVKKKEIIFDYSLIAQDYISLDAPSVKFQKICVNVDCKNIMFDPTDDPAVFVCNKCFTEYVVLDENPTYKDVERVKMSSRYVYKTETHFRDATNNFECKQTKQIPQQVIDLILKQIALNKLSPKTIKKDQLYNILEYIQLNIYYEDINMIHFLITGEEPPDISEIIGELFEMHRELDEVFNATKEQKESSLNINFQLFKFLELLDFNCSRDDFFFIKTPANEKEYYDKWKILISKLQEKYPGVLNSRGKLRWRYIPYY
jgi:hypothetical protein